VTCVGLWLLPATPAAYQEYLGLLLLPPANAQQPLCCLIYQNGQCIKWRPCPPDGAEEDPTRPSDEVDWWGRLDAFDPQTPDIRVDFPLGAVTVPVQVSAYRTQELPADVPPPAGGSVGAPFYFGIWIKGEARTVNEFHEPIVINVGYEDQSALGQIPVKQPSGRPLANWLPSQLGSSVGIPLVFITYSTLPIFSPDQFEASPFGLVSPSDEERLRLSMYDPTTQAWVKLCSRVDPYANKVSAALLVPTPLEEGDNALFAVVLDDTPALEQVVDDQGTTTLFIPGDNLSIKVLAGTVKVGTHFEITRLPEVPESELYKLLPTPVNIKACQADYAMVNTIQQIRHFPKPMTVAFDIDANTLSRTGGRANLTIASLQDRRWVDLEEFGFRVVRDDTTLAVDTGDLGTFGMAVR
jgi:hypothetical protein